MRQVYTNVWCAICNKPVELLDVVRECGNNYHKECLDAAPDMLKTLRKIAAMPCIYELLGECSDDCGCASCLAKESVVKIDGF